MGLTLVFGGVVACCIVAEGILLMIPSRPFPTSQSKIPSRKFAKGTAEIQSRQFAKAPAKEKRAVPVRLDGPTDEHARQDRLPALVGQTNALRSASEL